MKPSKKDNLKANVEYWEKEVESLKKNRKKSGSSIEMLKAKRALNMALLELHYHSDERSAENLGFSDCPILDNIACSKDGEVMRKDWELVYTSNTIRKGNRTYQAHRLICFTFNNEGDYPQEFLDLYCDVHHKNGNHKDNRAENLCFITKDYHAMIHRNRVKFDDIVRKQLIQQQYNIYSMMFK